jgi:regulator of protease activity HflC (stomatin/prohibitin superfamily)
MPHYRITELDLSTRREIGLEMLQEIPERDWGRATELAQKHGISRTLLYQLRDRAEEGLNKALLPRKPGPKPQGQELTIDRDFIRLAVTVLSMLKGSVRDIQLGLKLLFSVSRSIGYISETLQDVGAAAADYNDSIRIPLPMLGELDETFQGRNPCLTVVDGRSFLVLNLTAADHRDGTTWGVTLLDLQERGIQFHDLVSDGAKGIRSGVEDAELSVPLRPDLFHLTQDAHKIARRLERAAYRAMETAERARRAERERQAPRRRPGRPLEVDVSLDEAEEEEEDAIDTYDGWIWLWGEARRALEPINEKGQLTRTKEAQETMEAAIELLQEIEHDDVTDFALGILDRLDDLLAPLIWLEECLAPWREEVDDETEALILWAWQHREALELEPGEGFPESQQRVAQAFWEVLALFHRSSSLAESFHSWLRPYLHIHRGMPQWLFPLLTLLWNHHIFQRGKREGKSPLELAGVDDVPSLSEVLSQLLGSMSQTEPEVLEEAEALAGFGFLLDLEPAQVVA